MADERGQDLEPEGQLTITSLEALKVISDPLRMRVVDALRRAPGTVKGVAGALGVPPKSLYYHVGLLEKHGLIRVVDTRLVSGITEKRYRATAYLFNFQDLAPADRLPDGQSMLEATESMLDITRAELRRCAQDGALDLADDAAPERALHGEWALLRLSPARVAELSARLRALIHEYEADGAGEGVVWGADQTYRLLLTLFPTYPRSPEAERPGSDAESGK